MASHSRQVRVAELVREEIASMILHGLKDPRIGFVSVMNVRMSPDLRYANVYISAFGSDKEKRDSLVGLQRSAGWIRREVGKKLRLRHTPQIRIFEDSSLDTVYHLEEVFERLHADEAPSNPAQESANDDD